MLRTLTRRFRRDAKGAAAVEFAMVAIPFFALIFVIIEVGMTYYASATLDDALRRASDQIQTGVAHERKMTAEQFQSDLCGRLPSFMSCSNVVIDVRLVTLDTFDDFATSGDVQGVSSQFRRGSRTGYCIGGAGDYILARVAYRFPDMFKFVITRGFQSGGQTITSVEASRVFRNEPFLADPMRC